jgi:Flp pilus assembly pilin Flp
MLGSFGPDAVEFQGTPVMTKLLRRFMLCRKGVTAIECALIASLIAIVIVTAVGAAGTQLSSSFTRIASAFP